MIELNDLRIGNIVKYDDNQHDKNWTKATKHDISRLMEDPSMYPLYPIKITKEWLVNLGFEPNGEYESMRIRINNEGMTHSYLVASYSGGVWIDTYNTHTNEEAQTAIESRFNVHQLQNLYYLLAGKELQYEDRSLRATGRSTRLADQLIQELFTKGEITVVDHYRDPLPLFYTIINRLFSEHVNTYALLDINKSNFTIKLKNK